MADKITWADKESLVTDPTIAEKNKVTDNNMNEIKSVTNTNADELAEKIVYDENDITENTSMIIEEVPEGSNIPYINSEIAIGSSNEDNRPVWFKKSKNLFNKGNVINAYLNSLGVPVSNNDWRVSDYISLNNITQITGSGDYQSTSSVNAFYDSNKTFISSFTGTTAGYWTKNVPINAKYIRITTNNTTLNTFQLEKGSTATTYEPYITPRININGENLFYANDYSTTEQVVGKWINGKPIYRKVITYGTMPTGAEDSPTVNHNIANIDLITHWYGFCVNNNGLQYNFDHVAAINMGSNMTIATRINKQWVQIAVSSDMSSFTGYFVIEYTKTTD